MQKLSKELVKKLIYEVVEYDRESKQLKVLDDEGNVLDTRKDFPEDKIKETYPKEDVVFTKESIDRIIRQEVRSFFEVK